MMDREKAFQMMKENLKTDSLINHCLAVEACMREVAEHFGEDVEKWGLAGLLHDLDYQFTINDPDNHTLETEKMLVEYQLGDDIINAIKAHDDKAGLDSRMNIALYSVDPTSGFIIACALMHPSKQLENINLKRMKKRFKTKTFAAGADRERIKTCEKMDMELEEFLVICLTAMQKISDQLGL